MSEVKDFLKALSENPDAKKLMQEAKEPANLEEAAALYADIAAKTGISVTKETIQELLEKKEKAQQAASEKAADAVKEALDDAALDNVAGGTMPENIHENCSTTYKDDEWCWFNDSCSVVISYYDGDLDPNKPYQGPAEPPPSTFANDNDDFDFN